MKPCTFAERARLERAIIAVLADLTREEALTRVLQWIDDDTLWRKLEEL